MASGGGTSNAQPPEEALVNQAAPLWKHVTLLEKTGGKSGGNVRSHYHFCQGIINGSYSRVKAHLLKISGYGTKGCPKVTIPILE